MNNRINISDELYLSAITDRDVPFYVKYLNDPEIAETTLRIPFPYREEDAKRFIELVRLQEMTANRQMHWAVRNCAGELIGGIGLHGKYPETAHRDEVGYWLAKPYWSKGIMTSVLKAFCSFVEKEYKLERIEAPIFDFNTGSCRVAEKCGFVLEGVMRKAYFKNGKYVDGKLYALVK